MQKSQFVRFGRSRLQQPPSADSPDVICVAGRRPTSPRPSSYLCTSHGEGLPIDRAPDDLTSQLALVSVIPERPEHSNLTTTPDPDSLIAQPPIYPSMPSSFDTSERRLGIPQHSQTPAMVPRQSWHSQLQPLLHQHSPQPQGARPGVHYDTWNNYESKNVSVEGNMNHINYNYASTFVNSSNNFMEKLLEKTIPGAAFDSSARDPPPRCHPGTRLAILERCLYFITNCGGTRKMRWVFGAAGVGKSAVMQNVAESPLASVALRASIFFFVNGRSDGSKAIITLAYQLAAKCDSYRQFIEREITRDPSLLQKSMSVQFNKFIIEPFIHHPQLNSADRVLIIIDGLDECDQSRTQRELLRLIADFCLVHPSSPIVWMIASRQEPHITSFFIQASVEAAYEKEEILVDSDEACKDVERFLRIELTKIKAEFSLDPQVQLPSEPYFWKLAHASGGLFIYAQTVIKYIGDPDIGDPISQLNDVLQVIDAHPLANVSGEEHPMALLDNLYSRILSKVPNRTRKNARRLLLALLVSREHRFDEKGRTFIVLCNWLGMTSDEAYAALRHLGSVLIVPGRGAAHKEDLRYFHKSFIDYIFDFSRSGFSLDIKHEVHQLYVQCTFRILKEAPDGIDVGDLDYDVFCHIVLARGPGSGDNISLTWFADEASGWDDNRTRLYMYKMAVASVVNGIENKEEVFYSVFCVRLLATCLRSLRDPGIHHLHEVVFDKSRDELVEQGLLHQMPVELLDFRHITWRPRLQFRRLRTSESDLIDPWNPYCEHKRECGWGTGRDLDQAWSTRFVLYRTRFRAPCDFCRQRLERHLQTWKAQFPDYPVFVLFISAGVGLAEFKFVDLDDGTMEWTYWLVLEFDEEERRKLGSTV